MGSRETSIQLKIYTSKVVLKRLVVTAKKKAGMQQTRGHYIGHVFAHRIRRAIASTVPLTSALLIIAYSNKNNLVKGYVCGKLFR